MKTENGWSGSHNPGNGAKPTNLAYPTGNPLVVTRLKRIKESQPTAWEGETPGGHKVHIAYLHGEVSVEVMRPLPERPGFGAWITVARFKPSIIEAELEGKTGHERYALSLMAERAMVSEIRRSNEAEMRSRISGARNPESVESLLNRGRLVIRDSQLLRWLETRNHYLDLLLKRGVAGGLVPVRIPTS